MGTDGGSSLAQGKLPAASITLLFLALSKITGLLVLQRAQCPIAELLSIKRLHKLACQKAHSVSIPPTATMYCSGQEKSKACWSVVETIWQEAAEWCES